MGADSWPTTKVSLLVRMRGPADQEAWQDFVDLYRPLVYNYCRRRGLQDSDAADVAQETMAQVLRSIPSFDYDPDQGRFRGWLGTITHRAMQRFVGKMRRIGRGAGDADGYVDGCSGELDAEWVDTFNAHIYARAVQRVRSHFDAETWRVFELMWEQGVPAKAVASQMDRNLKWVYRARKAVVERLRQEIDDLAGDTVLYTQET